MLSNKIFAFCKYPVRKIACAPSNELLRTVMFFVRESVISEPVIFKPSMVMFAAGLNFSAIDAVAPASGVIVTLPVLIAPAKVP